MLSFETPSFEIDGITLFPDHEDGRLFYYSAAQPRVALGSGGRPMFDLWVYTKELVQDQLGGTRIPEEMGAGFLTLGVNCRRDRRELDRLSRELARTLDLEPDDVRLSAIPYKTGEVRLIALDQVSGGGGCGRCRRPPTWRAAPAS